MVGRESRQRLVGALVHAIPDLARVSSGRARLLLVSRLRGAALQLGHDGVELDAAGSQQNEQMIEDIGGF